ncbi:S9 family peptidase [Devriesea agamarum]|uniref:S9 family peptidase n=1 Tax=Devriesea agamarum TaxID=472569 RepID=UPI00071C7428|nr:prolyl oligopeptidase family serine peptidase [Devriesea agamarum]
MDDSQRTDAHNRPDSEGPGYAATGSAGSFASLSDYVALRRHNGLRLSPDGTRLIAVVSELGEKKNSYVSSLWELPTGRPGSVDAPVRLTRGREGESLIGFTPEGDILFTGKRADNDDEGKTTLYLLPRSGGEAFPVLTRDGSIEHLLPARTGGRMFFIAPSSPRALAASDDEDFAKDRRETKTSAILHEGFPVRAWDEDLGPAVPQVFFADPRDAAHPDAQLSLHRVTALEQDQQLSEFAVNSDGTLLVAQVSRTVRGVQRRSEILAVDVNSGMSAILASEEGYDLIAPVITPDDRRAVLLRQTIASVDRPLAVGLSVVDLDSGQLRSLDLHTPDGEPFTDWPEQLVPTADSRGVLLTADRLGYGAIYYCDLDSGVVYLLTDDKFMFTSISLDEASGDVHALANAIDRAPFPVVLRGAAASGRPRQAIQAEATPTPIEPVQVPGQLTEITTTAEDGTPLRAWLCLPDGVSPQSPAPFLLWVHGGPMGSWNGWSWRWNPWTATARGYAVLLPDPAISTGYGQAMIDRGWGQLGGTPFDDIMRLTRVALDREDIDDTRKAAMGGSYGGYMANWIAGHTGTFFNCVITHASLWALDQMRATTDCADFWSANLSDQHNELFSPHLFASNIEVPMLVIHGDKDYRVPIGEGLRLWYDLLSHENAGPGESRHKFLYFPDENHWVLSPNNSAVWYETVFAFLAQHVLGEPWQRPRLLG